jgi:hypothetical protein
MAQPTVLTTNTGVIQCGVDPFSGSTTFTKTGLSIEAGAKTVIVVAALTSNAKSITDITFNDGVSDVPVVATFPFVRASNVTKPRNANRALVFDLSKSGASNSASITVTSDTAHTYKMLIYALYSDGFLQSAYTDLSYGNTYDFNVYNPNYKNSRTIAISLKDDDKEPGDVETVAVGANASVVTQLTSIAGVTGSLDVAFAAIQTTDSVEDAFYTYELRNAADDGLGQAEYCANFTFQITSQAKPFGNSFNVIDSVSDDAAFAAIFD